jgi:hypothetical protein
MKFLTNRERLTQRHMSPAGYCAGVTYHTADQENFRSRARGRWTSDVVIGTHAPASSVIVAPNGCVDVTSLCQDGTSWIDLGGSAGVDFRAGRI